jgi:propanol-preferring alcohol dehydrogenase
MKCNYCLESMENLCPEFKVTGRDANGGYAGILNIILDSHYYLS